MTKKKASPRLVVGVVASLLLLACLAGLWLTVIDLLVIRGSRSAQGASCTHLYVLALGPLTGVREVSYVPLELMTKDGELTLGEAFSAARGEQGIEAACLRLKREVKEVLGRPVDYYFYFEPLRLANAMDGEAGVVLNVARREKLLDREGTVVAELAPGPNRLSGIPVNQET